MKIEIVNFLLVAIIFLISMKSIRSYFQPISKIDVSNKRMKFSDSSTDVDNQNIEDKSTIALDNSASDFIELDYFDNTWKNKLNREFSKPYFKNLLSFVNKERTNKTIYPTVNRMFACFSLCSYSDVKVVIIGQDPYHGPNQANGLAFSVNIGVPLPPSLQNILKEAQDDVGIKKPTHGNLDCWSRQGVLLLNTCLTVRQGEPNSHQKQGWEIFTDAVIESLCQRDNIVYLLWGNPAQTKCKMINKSLNTIITSSHPSPLGAYKTNQPFMGSRCFSRCNETLIKYGKEPIDWNVY